MGSTGTGLNDPVMSPVRAPGVILIFFNIFFVAGGGVVAVSCALALF